MITRILVPTDFSEPSEAALACARAIARGLGATLHALHVIDASSPPETRKELTRDASLRFARRILPSDKARYGAVREIIMGNPARTIVQSAKEHNCDLIVMGADGRSGVAHPRLGSVAEHVLHWASCPVLIIRADGRQRIPIEERTPEAIAI